MKIGVYRIYLGQSWHASERVAALTALFDSIPEFLYRIDTADPADVQAGDAETGALRAHLRIAMTQSHIVLIDADAPLASQDASCVEITLAHSGFRRRLPVLAVSGSGALAPDSVLTDRIDGIVALAATPLTCAIQELVEAAGAAARAQAREPVAATAPCRLPRQDVEPGTEGNCEHASDRQRPLPFDAIAQAFHALRDAAPARRGSSRQGS